MIRHQPSVLALVLSAVGAALLVSLSQHHVFFWDTIQLASKQAAWIYENAFTTLLLPDRIDSGHPPGLGLYLAACWRWLGRSLVVSHWAMWPWLWLLFYQLWRLCVQLAPRHSGWLLALVLADPVLLGQSVLVSPDIILLAAFLLGLNGILSTRRWMIVAAVLLLGTISMRGMLVGLGLFVVDLGYAAGPNRLIERLPGRLVAYLPGGMLALLFLWYHYLAKGWIGYHPASPWAPSFAGVDTGGLLRNMALLGWRWLDYGRFILWLAATGLFVAFRRRVLSLPPILRWLGGSWLLFSLLLAAPLLPHQGLMVHRYLLPAFVLFSLLVGSLLIRLIRQATWRRAGLSLAILLLLLGNAWVYPRQIAQGWDATLAHWPYYRLRSQVLHYIEREGISLADVGTAFPEIGPLDERDLSGRQDGMAEKALHRQRYIFYSNIMNDFSDAELQTLDTHWHIRHQVGGWPVRVVLYERK